MNVIILLSLSVLSCVLQTCYSDKNIINEPFKGPSDLIGQDNDVKNSGENEQRIEDLKQDQKLPALSLQKGDQLPGNELKVRRKRTFHHKHHFPKGGSSCDVCGGGGGGGISLIPISIPIPVFKPYQSYQPRGTCDRCNNYAPPPPPPPQPCNTCYQPPPRQVCQTCQQYQPPPPPPPPPPQRDTCNLCEGGGGGGRSYSQSSATASASSYSYGGKR